MKVVEAWHGTTYGYRRHRCRCEECRAANASYAARWRADNPEKAAAHKATYRSANRERVLTARATYRATNPSKIAAQRAADVASGRNRERKYGLAPGQYTAMLAEQDNRCASCGSEFGGEIPHIDHDHACCPGQGSCGKCVRGLLCHRCNNGLGCFSDDPDRLRQAITYLERSR